MSSTTEISAELPAALEEEEHRSHRVRVRRKHRQWWRRKRPWAIGIGAVAVLILGDGLIRYVPAALALEHGKTEVLAAKALLTGSASHRTTARVDLASADLTDAKADFSSKSDVFQTGILAKVAGHLPELSEQIHAVNALRAAGESGAAFAIDVTSIAHQVSTITPGTGSTFQKLVSITDKDGPQLKRTVRDLATFRSALAAVPSNGLLGPLDSARTLALKDGGEVSSEAGPALQLLQALPAVVGPGSHTYLVLLNNPGEERPGGGFIGAAAVIEIDNGAIEQEQVITTPLFTPVPGTPAPAPLNQYLFRGVDLDIGDANWSPDFPTASQDVMTLFTKATGVKVDGVISIDPVGLSYILKALGPISVPGYAQKITAQNALLQLNYITNEAIPGYPGKAYLAPLANIVLTDMLHQPVSGLEPLATQLHTAATQEHAVLYFTNPSLEALVQRDGVGGQLQQAPPGDAIMVNDANLSGTKGDLFVTRHFSLDATVLSNGNVNDTLTLAYTNPVVTNAADQSLVRNSGSAYRDYIQVVLPETAQLSDLTVQTGSSSPEPVAPQAISYTFQREIIGIWVVTEPGTTSNVTLHYTGPFANVSTSPETYSLTWQKQVNALTSPISITVHMPSGQIERVNTTLATGHSYGWANHSH